MTAFYLVKGRVRLLATSMKEERLLDSSQVLICDIVKARLCKLMFVSYLGLLAEPIIQPVARATHIYVHRSSTMASGDTQTSSSSVKKATSRVVRSCVAGSKTLLFQQLKTSKSSVSNSSNVHCRFSSLNNRVTRLEKTMNRERRRIKRLEKRLRDLEDFVADGFDDDEESQAPSTDESTRGSGGTVGAGAKAEYGWLEETIELLRAVGS